jgi:hypothetical protein
MSWTKSQKQSVPTEEIDINTPFFGNSGAKYDKAYLDECIKKATPGLSKIKDVDKTLDEIRGLEPTKEESQSHAISKDIS